MSESLLDFGDAFFKLTDGVPLHIYDGPDAFMVVVNNVENANLLADTLQDSIPACLGSVSVQDETNDDGGCDPVDDFMAQMKASRRIGEKGVAVFKGEIDDGELQFTVVPYSEFPFGENQTGDDPADQ